MIIELGLRDVYPSFRHIGRQDTIEDTEVMSSVIILGIWGGVSNLEGVSTIRNVHMVGINNHMNQYFSNNSVNKVTFRP